jgi:serine/threonine protein kinase
MSGPGSKAGGFESKCDDDESPSSVLSSWALIDFDDITVGKFIAGGGAGVIHEGIYKGERVALKALFDHRISEELKREFMNELLVMSRLDHSNIVQFKGASVTPPNLCFVMEMCDSSLDHILHVEKEFISDYEKVQMAIDIAQAMEYLHSLKPAVIHRDLKALNVLKSADGVLKLCDFGLVSNKISAAGTPGYMAPGEYSNDLSI